MARASKDFETFNGRADAGGGYASAPVDDGGDFRAAAQMFQGLGARLGAMADKAAARTSYDKTLKEADAAIGLPEVTFKLKPGKTDEGGTGRREPKGPPAKVPSGDVGAMIKAAAAEIGADPVDYATAISYETGGTFSTKIKGGKDGKYEGIIQFGPEERAKYGAHGGQSFGEQLAAANRFFKDRGFKPGMGLIDLYSTINAGSPGRHDASDGPGNTVRGHVEKMMSSDHRKKAEALIGGKGGVNIGGDVGAQAPFVPSSPGYEMQVKVPEPQPLALRRDGTISGEAHDRAIAEVAGWKMQAGLDAELGAAYENNKDDPAAFQAAVKDVADRYVKQAADIGPEVGLAIKQRAAGQLLTLARDVQSRNEQKVDGERKSAALAAVDEAARGIERQAYLIGGNEDGDERLTALAAQAHGSIDAALATGAITPEQARGKREQVAQGLVSSRIQGVFDALPDVAQKQAFVDGLDEAYADPKSPLAVLQPETFRRIKEGLAIDARQQAEKASATTAMERFTVKRALDDDLASMEATGKGGKIGAAEIDPAEVARVLGPDDAAAWLETRGLKRKLWETTSTMPVMPADKIEAVVEGLKPKAGEDGFDGKQALYQAAQKRAEAVLELRKKDPAKAAAEAFPQEIGAAMEAFDPAKPETLQQVLTSQAAAQAAIGIEAKDQKLLTQTMAKQLAGRMIVGPDEAAEVALTLAGSAGPHLDAVMRQISDEAPALAVAADIATRGGGDAGLRYIAQQQALERDPAYKKPEMSSSKLAGAVAGVTPAFAALPKRMAAVQQNAWTIFKAMARERGVAPDLDGEDGQALFETSLQLAAGAEFKGGQQYGGFTAVNGLATLVPVGMDATQVEIRLRSLSDEAFKTLPPILSGNGVEVRAKDLREARLVAVRDGVYRVAMGDPQSDDPQYLMGKDMQPWLLDMRKLPAPRPRPDAPANMRWGW